MSVEQKDFFTTRSIVSSDRVLYTPSAFAKATLLHLQEIGKLRALAPHTSRRSNLTSYLFFTVLSGSGKLDYNGKEYALRTGDCAFFDCQKPYSHTTSEDLWSLSWCHFYGPGMSLIYQKYMERGGKPVFTPASAEIFTVLLDSLYAIASGTDFIRDMRINEELNSLLTLLMEESWHPEEGRAASKKTSVTDVKEYLDRHYTERIALDDLAARFYINKYYLDRVFREQFGRTITAYLQTLRITHAKQLLRFTDKSLEEIGQECGLGSPNYFSRVFRKIEGISPSSYRSQW